jgi:hypothetical protein
MLPVSCLPQAAARTNDLAGDGTTTATILSAAMIAEGMKIVAAGANPVQVGTDNLQLLLAQPNSPSFPFLTLFALLFVHMRSSSAAWTRPWSTWWPSSRTSASL